MTAKLWRRALTVLAIIGVFCACEQGELPIDDLCVVEAAEKCVPCTTDADCIIGGAPCCHPQFKYYCGHTEVIEAIEECTNECVAETPQPSDESCRCIQNQCHSG